MSALKLTVELVPRTSWYSNMRSAVSKDDWDKIRKQTYAAFGHRCGICQTSGMIHCHEIWHYDDENYVQTLEGFIALCEWCHHVKHIGLAGILADEGKLDYEKVVEHFMQVNVCDRLTFEKHVALALRRYRKRSMYQWKVELGIYKDMAKGR
ncbi:HNH endonuclease [bacterium]|nr:MAG: HNH endonuclease [bacterium]